MIQSKIFLAALFTSMTLHAGFFLLSGNPLKFKSGKPEQKTAIRVSILNTPAANGKPTLKTVEPPIKKIAVGKSIGPFNKRKVKTEETPYESFREPEPDIAGVEPATLPAPQGEIEGVREAVPAGSIGIIRPRYPVFSRRLGEEGRVVLLVKIGADGTINDISTSSSSGYPRLDRAAVEAVKNSVFKPELRVNTPVPSTKAIAFTFKLKD